jgi:asparagine synthase (glutamine-hydrolysing)
VEKRLVFFSRDRFGIKPLYYVVNQDEIAFASEIKGLLAGGVAPVPEVDALARYLVTGLLDGDDRTLFAGVRQLPPGHNAMVSFAHSRLDLHVARYWTLPAEEKGLSAHQAISEFRELFTDSVRVHARSDVPVGTCLSGGVDSSSIVCVSQLLRERGGIPQYTHTAVGYCAPEAEFSELRYMNEVARATGASLHYVDVTTQAFEREVANVIACQDEPFGSASIAAQWFVFRKARELGLKVMLDGQGADEALGGYLHYFAAKGLNLLSRGHLLALVGLVMRYRVRYGAFPLPPNVFSLRRHAARLPRPMAGLLKAVVHLGHGPSQRSSASTRGPFTAEIGERAEDEHDRTYPRVSEKLRIQLEKECLPALLRYEDRNSMAHSIEARVPFLDHRLINLIFRMPERMKIRGVTTKYVLREAMRGVLPETIRTRTDKIGFKASPGLTLRLARENEEAFVRNDTEVENRAFREEGVRTLLRMVEDDPSLEFMLWRVLNTKLWARNHWG